MIILEQTNQYTLYQSDNNRLFYIDFGSKTVQLSFCQLLAFRQKIQQLDITTHFDEALNPHGLEIITLCNNEHLFLLDTYQVIALKTLLQNAFTAMGLSKKIIPVTA